MPNVQNIRFLRAVAVCVEAHIPERMYDGDALDLYVHAFKLAGQFLPPDATDDDARKVADFVLRDALSTECEA